MFTSTLLILPCCWSSRISHRDFRCSSKHWRVTGTLDRTTSMMQSPGPQWRPPRPRHGLQRAHNLGRSGPLPASLCQIGVTFTAAKLESPSLRVRLTRVQPPDSASFMQTFLKIKIQVGPARTAAAGHALTLSKGHNHESQIITAQSKKALWVLNQMIMGSAHVAHLDMEGEEQGAESRHWQLGSGHWQLGSKLVLNYKFSSITNFKSSTITV